MTPASCNFPYIYSDGVYIADHRGTKLKKIIRGFLYPQFIKSRTINQVYNLLADAEELQKDFADLNKYPASYINFRDCMVDMKTMQEIPHSPEYLSVNQLPFKYEDVRMAAEGKEIEKFFSFIFTSDDDREMFLEYAGLCFTTDVSQQRFLTLCGLGGTGKSILIRLVQTAVGACNVSNVGMQELEKRFSTSMLLGKTLNACADLPIDALNDARHLRNCLVKTALWQNLKAKMPLCLRITANYYSQLIHCQQSRQNVQIDFTEGFLY